jgi:hypothetical protein
VGTVERITKAIETTVGVAMVSVVTSERMVYVSIGASTTTGAHGPYLYDLMAARDIRDALIAANLDAALASQPKRYCGGGHCSQLWNLPCDDPGHRGVGVTNKPEGK